ncbi:ADP-ribosylglycohydrolase [Trematosphaeria pertusa]|uniref:ADP-ribosylglycohydrolase n=1 Tax=Trematosphaeria pertusa TaxID=390896 RepID=A0A6A6ILZ3_9PLEO|nr:ADP-ribosylglycohydrolase [Trematosphaeria pertusa]KAF2251461.1 ADP-ribosylglycohydrolase [Trematosphaeria pertusa]
MSSLPPDYLNKIYAGVLGKLIGVYLGRPFENWTYHEILEKLGPVHYYVHEQLDLPLVVIDDDVSGTFAFVRALDEHGAKPNLTSEEVWLNQVIEKKTIFWWGGHGISTEHTAFNNLKKGIRPPASGSIAANGKTIAEQIGAQIFIDGWALVSPGNPAFAARLAEAAARVSHDGVAVHAAVLWAAMEAEAFKSKDVNHLLNTGLSSIPSDSPLRGLISDIRSWVEEDGNWEKTRQRIEDNYGYDKYTGICHMIPNHGIMIMALLYGAHDFSTAMHIINTSGWDTDCNSGNIGCLLAIMHGLAAFENDKGLDWRGPLADRALISSADGGYSINDAVRLTYSLANLALKLAGEEPLNPPKGGAQWHFSLPGSVQGFQTTSPPETITIAQSLANGVPALGIHIHSPLPSSTPIEVLTQTFTPLGVLQVSRDYEMMACPLIYPGQLLTATLSADAQNTGPASITICVKAYDYTDELIMLESLELVLVPGKLDSLTWTAPKEAENRPIQAVGIAVRGSSAPLEGTVWLRSLKCEGTPKMTLKRPEKGSGSARFWQRAFVSSVHKAHTSMGPSFYLAQGHSEGVFVTGTREWSDYSINVSSFCMHLGSSSGIIVRYQSLNRWHAVQFRKDDGKGYVAIVKARDERREELARAEFDWALDVKYTVTVALLGNAMSAVVGDRDGRKGVEVQASDFEYEGGGAGFVVSEGCVSADSIQVC